MIELNELKNALRLSLVKKKSTSRSASIAYSLSGRKYRAGLAESDTNFFSVGPEQLVLAFSTQNNDFLVNRVVTLVENPKKTELVSPTTAKILIDHSVRTGLKIEYQIVDLKGKTLFEIKNVRNFFKRLYNPETKVLTKAKSSKPALNKIKLEKGQNILNVLKERALEGIGRNFSTSDSASGYGTAVLTENGTVYFGGQYSSFEKRTLHSEMAVVLRAVMDGNSKITHLGLASSKYEFEPCNMCGGCRQFFFEIISRFGLDPEIHLFSQKSSLKNKTKISKYLPNPCASKKA